LRIAAFSEQYAAIERCSAAKWGRALADKGNTGQPILIKKYANRRLYNTATSSYVTLEHLSEMVKDGTEFVVEDAKSGEDITRSVLTQIIFEEESKGQNLLPIRFLRQLISYYGDNLESVVPQYLDFTMESFTRNQDAMREHFANTLSGSANPLNQFEEVTRQNMAVFQQAMSAFNPFQAPGMPGAAPAEPAKPEAAPAASGNSDDLSSLKDKLSELEKQIDKLSHK
jgi:polyhydroxyalkanoate synthesis repressor PhaR